MTKMHAKLKQYLKLFKKFVFLTKRTCTFVRPGDARITWRNAFDLHVEKYSGKNDCGERPLLCIFRHFGGLYLLKERC